MTNRWPERSGFRAVWLSLCLGAATSAQALSLAVEDGEIQAILGIEIQGKLYDITFENGAFNTLYPAGHGGYGHLAQAAGESIVVASASGALRAAANGLPGLKPRGCGASATCTILVPHHSEGAAPSAQTTHALELIYSGGAFRGGSSGLWPFDASTDTKYMPDMTYAILTPAH